MSSYADVSPAARPLARMLARGCYQLALLSGREALSGATLRGKQKDYSSRYRASAANFLARLRSAGLVATERRGSHGKRVLVVCLPCEVTS